MKRIIYIMALCIGLTSLSACEAMDKNSTSDSDSLSQTTANQSQRSETITTKYPETGSMSESPAESEPNSGTISTGELLDITDGKVWLIDATEKNGQTYVIYSENKKAKLGTYKNGKISGSVEIEGSRVDIFDKGCEKIGIISQKRFGIIEKLAVYNNSLEKINEAEFSDDSGITSICLSKNGDSYFVSYDKAENGEVFCVIETRNFSGEISEIGRFSSYEKDNPDKPFSIEVISQINENELFCKGFYLKAGSDDGIPCYGVVDIQSGNFKSVSSGETRGYQAIKNGFVLYDEALEYSMTSSGKAEIYICDNAEVFTFSTPNESQRVMLSQNGKYIVTNRTEYSKDTPEKTTLRVYDVTTHKLLTENVIDESKYHFNGTIFISENERHVLISAFDDSDNSYVFRVDF